MDRPYPPPPAPPPESEWHFVQDLQSPLWTSHPWVPRPPLAEEADLRQGLMLVPTFADSAGLLTTAYEDVRRFAAAGGIPWERGYRLLLRLGGGLGTEEAFCLVVGAEHGILEADDAEGIRRGLFHIEDLMLRAGGAFLPLGTTVRRPFIRRRISRCFFGPIKRPPALRDELLDDVDYYPNGYLNRLAHEGVNGLWLTVEFRDLCRTSITPEYGACAERRFAKLRRTVERCLRHGIRIYAFCIEPRAWDERDAPILRLHPELGPPPRPGERRLFCPFSAPAQTYLREATACIFRAVPELGGLITISHGERPTTCLSALAATGEGRISCPVCRDKRPWEILRATLSAMEEGIHGSAPGADLISWLYMPQPQGNAKPTLAEWVYEIPEHIPPGVVLQFNFESGVRREVFGRELVGGDYWLSNPGPSDRFERVAASARSAGVEVSAKIQTGCSHELATVPFVPIPGMIYRKFAAMRRLGVSSVMLCWYFGNYPGVMNKAAGELSFEPFPETEDAFLEELARLWWGRAASRVARAWKLFAEGYAHYPLTNLFQYYGPVHDGPVWPLHAEPADLPLAPTWQLASSSTREPWPPSGDRVGEAIGESLTLAEAVELCRRMAEGWRRGMRILRPLRKRFAADRERLRDIGLAETIGLHLRSASNILRFYALREDLPRAPLAHRGELVRTMSRLAREELAGGGRLLALYEADPRLGFHSEAEGYKVFPAKIRWRMEQLRDIIRNTLPALYRSARNGEPPFREYSGLVPSGPLAQSVRREGPRRDLPDGADTLLPGLDGKTCGIGMGADPGAYPTTWAWAHDDEGLCLHFRCREAKDNDAPGGTPPSSFPVSSWRGFPALAVRIEPRRLWPCLWFAVAANGQVSRAWNGDGPTARVVRDQAGWRGTLSIPWRLLGRTGPGDGPLRLDVQRAIPGQGTIGWMPQHPWTPRLCLGSGNPADLGWLVFEEK
ncbi:MAG: hypothetical protein JXR77_13675 [Lentisphaeria bacterium]|nr:hypothetical protein [Lentisphaeria bacterium]